MPKNKVIFDDEVLIDLTSDSVTAEKLVSGTTAHDKTGAIITGTNPYEKTKTDAAAADLKTFLTDNGVTVPEGTLLDGLVELLSGVEVGGGSGGAVVSYGSFSPTTDADCQVVTHGLSVMPDIVAAFTTEQSTSKGPGMFFGVASRNSFLIERSIGCCISGSSAVIRYKKATTLDGFDSSLHFDMSEGDSYGYGIPNTATQTTFYVGYPDGGYKYLRGGRTYHWIAIGGLQ